MYGPGINCMERERNEPVFYNYFCRFRNDGGTIALYVGGGSMNMKEINHAAIMWNKTGIEYWKKRWYELVRKFANEME